MHNNSSLLGLITKTRHTTGHITDVLTQHTQAQYDEDHHFGMTPQSGTTMILSGAPEKNIRSALQPLLLTATARLPSTGGPQPPGHTRTGRMHLPVPRRPTSWTELVALLQTLPHTNTRPWRHVHVDHVPYQRTPINGYSHAWEPTEETP